jgi:hypothetical protein
VVETDKPPKTHRCSGRSGFTSSGVIPQRWPRRGFSLQLQSRVNPRLGTVNADGKGFVGKGDVQTARSYNNAALQKAVEAKSLKFTAEHPTSQSLTQSVLQSGRQVGTQSGVQLGTQTGTQTGSLAYVLDVDGPQGQAVHGFILKGWNGLPSYTQTGAPVWNTPTYDGWDFGGWKFGPYQFGAYDFGDYNFGDYTFDPAADAEWGEWDAAPGENPDDCLRSQNADKITAISNVITEGVVTDGVVTDGAIEDGAITEGDMAYGVVASGGVIPNGPAKVSVNGKAL